MCPPAPLLRGPCSGAVRGNRRAVKRFAAGPERQDSDDQIIPIS